LRVVTAPALPEGKKKTARASCSRGQSMKRAGKKTGYFFATAFGSSIDRTVPAFTPRWITFTPLGKFTTRS